MLNATPRLPDDDSRRIESGVSAPSRSAASTISVAALSLMEPAKLNPSHLRNSWWAKIVRRSTKRSSSLKASGAEMTDMAIPSPEGGVGVEVVRWPGGDAEAASIGADRAHGGVPVCS